MNHAKFQVMIIAGNAGVHQQTGFETAVNRVTDHFTQQPQMQSLQRDFDDRMAPVQSAPVCMKKTADAIIARTLAAWRPNLRRVR